MILELLTQLQAAEKIAETVVKAAEEAYRLAVKQRAEPEKIAALDPGRAQIVLGGIRTAIAHADIIVKSATPQAQSTVPAQGDETTDFPPTPPGAIPTANSGS